MRNVQQNIISELQAMASQFVLIQSRATALSAMFVNENISLLTDEDFAEIPSFAHITSAELIDAAVAINDQITTLNAGTPPNWAKMLKITESMPK